MQTTIQKHEPIAEEMADVLYSWKDDVIRLKEVGQLLRDARLRRTGKSMPIGVQDVYRVVSQVRVILEQSKNCTLVNVPGIGYRIVRSQSVDMAIFAAKNVRKTVMMADRTNRLSPLVDPIHIPVAIQKVFHDGTNRIERLSGIKRHLLEGWKKAFPRKEESNGDKA